LPPAKGEQAFYLSLFTFPFSPAEGEQAFPPPKAGRQKKNRREINLCGFVSIKIAFIKIR